MRQLFLFLGILLFLSSFSTALSITTHVLEKYSDVSAGERMYFEVAVKYPENKERKDLRITYEVLKDGILVSQSKSLRAIETQMSFVDFVIIPKNMKGGMYILKVTVFDYGALREEVSTSFQVVRHRDEMRAYFLILFASFVLVSILVIIDLARYRRHSREWVKT